jgi:hypothetical protein
MRLETLDRGEQLYGGKRPPFNAIIAFLKSLARKKRGRLSDKITVKTLMNSWEELARDIQDVTGISYNTKERAAMRLVS